MTDLDQTIHEHADALRAHYEGVLPPPLVPLSLTPQPHSRWIDRLLAERPAIAALGTFAVVAVLGLVALTLSMGTAPSENVPETVAEWFGSPFPGVGGSVPHSWIEGDDEVVDVTFTNGHRIVVRYPREWQLAAHPWTSSTGILLELEERREDGWAALPAQLTLTSRPDGSWDYQIIPNAPWTEDELDLAEQLLKVTVEPNGFPTIRTQRPLSHYTPDPEQTPLAHDYRGRSPWIDVMIPRLGAGVAFAPVESGCPADPENPHPTRTMLSVTWCDEDARVLVSFGAPPHLHDEIMNGMDIRLADGAE